MKKILLVLILTFLSFSAFAQTHATVDLTDDVYKFLTISSDRGYCKLSNSKPYSESYILKKLQEIKENCNENEIEIVDYYLSRYEHKRGLDFNKMGIRFENDDENFPTTFTFANTTEGIMSSGFYNDSDINSTGYEILHHLQFFGDLGKNFSYRTTGFIGLTEIPLQQIGTDYEIGYWWYDNDWLYRNEEGKRVPGERKFKRTVNTYRNNSFLPYAYNKKWDGSVYYLSDLTGSGLEGWPEVCAIGLGMFGDIHGEFFDNRLEVGFARVEREWAGMDEGSSLVLNAKANPFLGLEIHAKLADYFSFSTMTGVLEFPNADYINHNAWYIYDPESENGRLKDYSTVDSYFFHNAFSIAMINVDIDYVHADFGSTCIWPKRFEMGYLFPLIDNVVYQNYVGDYDNLGLFGDLKGIYPGVGSAWISIFLDEMYSFKHNPFTKTRIMYAYQGGAKVNIPFLPFANFSTRYTKVEPYCYTHQAIKKQPYYSHYLAESYTNNGSSLGYYLQPNSDELFVRMDSKLKTGLGVGIQYQFIRHGADYGSAQVRGSSIWSELPTGDREIYYKYFLHDGAYEWTHIFALDASYDFNVKKVPVQIYGSIGYVYDYWTQSEGGMDEKTPYHKINTTEYPVKNGFVLTVGFKAFSFANFQ